MPRSLFAKHTPAWLLILTIVAISLACSAIGGGATATPGPGVIITYGPGQFDLTDTKVGLTALSSYTAAVTITFDGTRGGQAEKLSKSYTMLATKSPQARQWTIERKENNDAPTSEFMAELGGLDYQHKGEAPCTAKTIQESYTLTDNMELAAFLHPVIGANEGGNEKVNGFSASHYTFDQRSLGEDGVSESTGEMWIATDGGYLVRYLLTRKGKANIFGEGIEGTETVEYELTNPNKPVTIKLPDDCPPGMIDGPLMPDAANVTKSPGKLVYETSSSIKDAAAFYQKQIPSLGWKADGEPVVTDKAAFLSFAQGDQNLSVVIITRDGKTLVKLIAGSSQTKP